jgi:hypothetical protein
VKNSSGSRSSLAPMPYSALATCLHIQPGLPSGQLQSM